MGADDELLPAARKLAETLGKAPSLRQLIAELHIGQPRARTLLDALATDTPGPATEQAPADVPDPFHPPGPPHPDTPETRPDTPRTHRRWPVLVLAAPAFVAVWSGWVGLGGLAGFGPVHPLPGIADHFTINSAITLPIGLETYGVYALGAWLSPMAPVRARVFARWSAACALLVGALGQVGYHLLSAAGYVRAPWPIVTAVSVLPVAVLGMGAALAHLLHTETAP